MTNKALGNLREAYPSRVVKKGLIGVMVAALLVALFSVATVGYQAYGWDEIRACLLDGDGSEFIVPVSWVPPAGTEFEQVLAAANYVANRLTYASDPSDYGDVWTSADSIGTSGDCEEFAILLCSLMRFSIGIPADRAWVQVGFITQTNGGETSSGPPIYGHAYVGYRGEHGVWNIEPQWGNNPYLVAYRGSKPSVTHWSQSFFPGGESSMLKFNDAWVRGGGPYLAGPRDNAGDGDLPDQVAAGNDHGHANEPHEPCPHPAQGMTGMTEPAMAASIHHSGSPLCGGAAALEEERSTCQDIPSDVEELLQGFPPKHGRKD